MSTPPDIIICIGHSRDNDNGAVSRGGVSEWDYNSELAPMIAWRLRACGWTTEIIDHYEGGNYTAAMRWLKAELEERRPRSVIELHFNAAGATARGHEWFHNDTGEGFASALDQVFRSSIAEVPARGTTNRHRSGNGSQFLGGAPCPAVIGEPFFGSNDADWAVGLQKERLATAYAIGITTWLLIDRVRSAVSSALSLGASAAAGQ